MTTLVQVTWLERVMDGALAAAGLEEMHRREVIEGVMFGSLRGLDTHGVALFRTYLAELESGRSKVHPRFEYRQRRPAIARLDADGALGMIAAFEATRTTAALTQACGVGVVVVANSNHFGAASLYTTALARQGLIGVAMTNSDALVVPVNGSAPMLGTNPISMAARGNGEDLFCADLATSQGSFLRSLAMRSKGEAVPAGVLADSQGKDAAESGGLPSALLPLGGHKGQCLGMMVTILCALLGEAPVDWDIANLFEGPFNQPRGISHLLLGLDVGAITERDSFRERLSRYLGAFRAAPAGGELTVTCPGDVENATAHIRAEEGVPISREDLAFLRTLELRSAAGGSFTSAPFGSA